MRNRSSLNYSDYLSLKYWSVWILLGLARLLAYLPLRAQWCLGAFIGQLAYYGIKRRREVALTNIRLCFPELDAHEQLALVKKSFRSNGIGLIESLRSWYRNPNSLKARARFHGLENLQRALEKGSGVILLGGHFSTLDIVGSLTTLYFEADVLQRDHSNPLFNAFMTRSRQRLYEHVIDKHDLRSMFKSLRANRVVWYATDQDYGWNNTVFVPFFGLKCSTLTSTSKIAKRSGAAVIPFSHFRDEKTGCYEVYLHPELKDFPGTSEEADAQRLNLILEQEIRRQPEQYLWMHRRFKTPEHRGDTNVYGVRRS